MGLAPADRDGAKEAEVEESQPLESISVRVGRWAAVLLAALSATIYLASQSSAAVHGPALALATAHSPTLIMPGYLVWAARCMISATTRLPIPGLEAIHGPGSVLATHGTTLAMTPCPVWAGACRRTRAVTISLSSLGLATLRDPGSAPHSQVTPGCLVWAGCGGTLSPAL